MPDIRWTAGSWRIARQAAVGISFSIVVVLLLMWLAGAFDPRIDDAPGAAAAASRRLDPGASLATVRTIRVPQIESSVGSIHAVHETSIASKLLARIVEVRVTAGKHVAAGDLLVRLDDAELKARLRQAQASSDAANAARDQARIEYDRVKRLFAQSVATQIEWDRVQTDLKAAQAELHRTEQAVTEAKTVLAYATIVAPFDGVVIDKRVEVGDTARPGQVLLTLYDPTRMQLVASVRESLTRRLRVGQSIGVRIDALDLQCEGQISEIVPEAKSSSRTFSVKVTGPCPVGVFTGMFGRLQVPLDDRDVLVVPRRAVSRVGQLTIVDVVDGQTLHRRTVRLGRTYGDDVEVLSGLRVGEQVRIPTAEGGDGTR